MTYEGKERRDDAEMRAMAKEVAHEAVTELMTAMGADVKRPLEMQEDFAFLRGLRIGTGLARRRVFMLILGGAVTGIGLLIWQGLTSYIPGK